MDGDLTATEEPTFTALELMDSMDADEQVEIVGLEWVHQLLAFRPLFAVWSLEMAASSSALAAF